VDGAENGPWDIIGKQRGYWFCYILSIQRSAQRGLILSDFFRLLEIIEDMAVGTENILVAQLFATDAA